VLVEKFFNDRCTTMASALAFSSMLSIVPFLAIAFAVLTRLDVQATLTPILLSNLAGGSQEVVTRILRYINNTRITSLGVIGLATLLFSVLATLDTIEEAFNQICGVARGKAVHHKLRDYLLVIFSIPLLAALAITTTTGLQHQDIIQWLLKMFGGGNLFLLRLASQLCILIALVCLYMLLPNVRIRLGHALAGAIIAGTAWQLAQKVFIYIQLGVSRQNAIYGTLALLPVFMLWIYTSWCIVLAGMEIIWHFQNNPTTATLPDKCPDGNNIHQTHERQGLPHD
jgi:membrane protein